MITKLLYGYKATQCLYVAAKLNIADFIIDGEKSVDILAQLTNSNADALYRVMRCLSSLGVFREILPKVFALNEAARDLLSESENTMKDFVLLCGEELYQSAGQLLYSVQSGKPAFDYIYGMSHWNYLEENPDKARVFHNAMGKGTAPMIREIISYYDFSSYKKIVDVGGGKGQLIKEILIRYPDAHGVIYDLHNARNAALDFINDVGLTDRCSFLSGDFFDFVPGADLYLLKVVLHDWNDERVVSILKNCRESMHSQSKLLIIEKIITNDQTKDSIFLGDINMLVTQSGKERNLDEFRHLLNQCNLELIQQIATGTVFSILEVGKK